MPFQPTLLTCSCPVLAVTSSILEYQRGHPNVHPADDEFLNAPQSSPSLAEPSFSSNKIKLNKLNVLTYLLIYCVHRERGVHSAKSGDFYLCTSCAGEYWPAVPLRAYRSWETSVQQWRVGLRHYRPQGAESDVRCRRSPVCSADSFTCTPFI